MTTPVLPPNPRQSLAYLQPGDKLKHATVVHAAPIIVKRGRIKAEVMHVALDNGREYCELPGQGRLPIEDLVEQLIPCQEAELGNPYAAELCDMQRQAGFSFYPKQLEYVQRIAARSGVMVAAETGVGKTLLAIALIHALKPRRCLVIAPQGVITAKGEMLSQWEAEFLKYAPWIVAHRVNGRTPVSIMTFDGVYLTYMQEALANDGGWLKDVPPDWYDMIIVDEAHLLQHRATIMAKALYRMQPARRYALTATPVGNKVEDCLSMLRWLRPDVEIRLPFHEEAGADGRPIVPASPLLTYRALAHALAPIRKRDIRPDMPKLTVVKVYIDPDTETAEAYREVVRNFTLKKGSAGQIERVRLTKLRNVCAESQDKARQIAWGVGLNPGVTVSARIEQTNNIITHIKRVAPEVRIGRIDSTRNPKNNSAIAAAFQRGELDVLLLGIKCAYGYSFPGCDTVHVASLEWSWGSFAQAVGRVWRVNSQRPVTAYVYLLRGTVEERMFDTVCAKETAATLALYGEAVA